MDATTETLQSPTRWASRLEATRSSASRAAARRPAKKNATALAHSRASMALQATTRAMRLCPEAYLVVWSTSAASVCRSPLRGVTRNPARGVGYGFPGEHSDVRNLHTWCSQHTDHSHTRRSHTPIRPCSQPPNPREADRYPSRTCRSTSRHSPQAG